MSTAGEAAALFGSEDSAADPFSLDPLNAETEQVAGQDSFAEQDVQSATDLFGSSTGDDFTFQALSKTQSQASYEYAGTEHTWSAHETQYASNYSDPSQYAATQNAYSQQATTQGYSAQQGQWAGYEPQQYNPPANGSYAAYSQTSSSQYTPYNTTNAYAPPAPATTTSYAPASHDIYASDSAATSAPAPAAYDPYQPKPTPTTNAAAPTQSAYDPYKPSQSAVQQSPYTVPVTSYQASSYAFTSPPAATASLLVPPVEPPQPARSAASAEAYRPKTSNAYDPPLPPPRPAARRTPAPTWSGSPTQVPYALPTSPPLTRGPPATLPPPPRTPSLPPPPRSSSTVSNHAPPSVRSPLVATHRSTPPPPRAALNGFSPPQNQNPLNKAFSPPPRSPSVTQYAPPSQPADYAYQPNGSAYGDHSLESSTGAQILQTQHLPPPPPDATVSAYQPRLQAASEPAHAPAQQQVIQAELLTTVPETTSEHEALQDFDDSEGGAYNGEDLWDEDASRQPAELYQSTVPSEASQPLHETHAEEAPATKHDAEGQPPAGEDPEAHVFEALASTSETSWTEDIDASQHASTASSPPRMRSPPVSQPPKAASGAPYDPYKPSTQQPVPRAQTPAERTKSPGNASIRSWSSSQRYSLDQDRSFTTSSPYAPPPRQPAKDVQSTSPYDPYAPAASNVQRSASPSTFSVRSVGSQGQDHSTRDPYAPTTSSIRSRSSTNGSAFSYGVSSPEDPYAPTRHRQASVESSSYTSFSVLQNYGGSMSSVASTGPSQVVNLGTPAHTPYAPSPSLLGTNDPLGRTSVRVPVISFGFGGKLVTCFHGSSALNTGFDVAMSSRASSIVHIRPLHTAISQSALDTSSATYPGPLFSDPGSPTTTLVRTGVSTQTKNKKARVIKYLEERAEEISQGIGYLHRGSLEGFRAEAKLTMIRLLKVMVESDGKLSGSAQIDTAVRAALLPNLSLAADATTEVLHVPALASSYPGHGSTLSPDDTTVVVHTLRSSQLNKIQQLLLHGDRRAACQYAADEKLWAHAMVIASNIDKEAWKEVVTEFLRSELSSKESSLGSLHSMDLKSVQSNGREPLKVAYSLFAGQGSASVQELLPPKPLSSMLSLQAPAPVAPVSTPMTASFPPPMPPMPLPKNILAKWTETAAMILSTTVTTESSSALTALGDQLAANNWIEAAHVCYLLSPQTSPIGGFGLPSGRVVLFGSATPQTQPNFWKDPDPIIFSEIVEFALSLATPAKGQEVFPGLPHLQPYRLIRAAWLAELGHMDQANRYCEAISSSLTRSSPYLNVTFGEQLKGLIDRLTAAPVLDKSGSWTKVTRPSLDKISNWFERGFTNFIAGEADSPKPVNQQGKELTFSGPFTHYSTISSAASSTVPSPQMSTTNLAEIPNASPFQTGSAMGLRPAAGSQIARASSAVDYLRRKPSPVPRVSSASAMTTSFGDLPSRGQNQAPYGYGYGYAPEATPRADRSSLSNEVEADEQVDTPSGASLGTWWGDSSAPTPTAASFAHPEPPAEASAGGFISLMDDVPTPFAATASQHNGTQSSYQLDDVDEEDDLGLSNSSSKPKPKAETPQVQTEAKPAGQAQPESAKEAEKPAAASGGWFSISKLWKRGEGAPGPVKANLGDNNNFYYDKDLKRWVNKNGPPEAAAPTKAPPPPRAQTASPSSSAFRSQPAPPTPGTPPVRPATAVDLTDGPPKKPPMRVRSNLVPTGASSAPNTPASAGPPRPPTASSMDPPGLDGPPMGGARKSAAKRNARSRYVDVFQESAS